MSNAELIEGRNLITDGDFSDNWREDWAVTGSVGERTDNNTGKSYLEMVDGATIKCRIDLPVRPDTDAVYWFSFSYEAVGNNPSNVKITHSGGGVIFDEPFMTRRQQVAEADTPSPQADFRHYEPLNLGGLEREHAHIDLLVTAASGGGRVGIRVTDFKIDLRLAPLELDGLSFDGRQIPITQSPQAALS